MPDFRVIQGSGNSQGSGKKCDADGGWARHHLHSLIIELLRALARGDDAQGRVAGDLEGLLNHLPKTSAQVAKLVDEVIFELHADIVRDRSIAQEGVEHCGLAVRRGSDSGHAQPAV
jgi:hypothetical protein